MNSALSLQAGKSYSTKKGLAPKIFCLPERVVARSPDDDFPFAHSRAVATVYSRLPGTLIVSLINAILIVLVVEEHDLARGPLAWLGLVAGLTLIRAAIYWRYRADSRRDAHVDRWARASVVGALCAGLLWGVAPVLQFSDFSTYQWLWAFAIGGMCAGAASLHAAHLPSALSFMIPASLPLAVSLILQGSLQGMAAASMTIAFIGLTTFTAILFSRDFARMQALRSVVEARAVELNDTNRRLSQEIADHRSTSNALYQSQKMEALGNLTGGFAHDFNNILTVIISNLEMIAGTRTSDSTRRLALSAIMAAESGSDLITRLLAFARKQTLTPLHSNIVEVVTEFQKVLSHAVSGNIGVAFDLAAPTATAHIDPGQLQAVLLNLVVNARDAMPDGGLITISVNQLTADEQMLGGTDVLPGEYVAISVADNGVGMSPETLERAFEPFFTTKGPRGGSGLGLAQVYGFARQSGGTGKIESTLGQGTRITIFLPAAEPSVSAIPESPLGQSPAVTERALSVLLADDNVAVLRAVESGLEAEGWTVRCVTNAGEAMAVVRDTPSFDVVVTDIDMPGGMDGLQLARELNERFSIPVLLMSGAPASPELSASGVPVIAKPFRKRVLVDMIRQVVEEFPKRSA